MNEAERREAGALALRAGLWGLSAVPLFAVSTLYGSALPGQAETMALFTVITGVQSAHLVCRGVRVLDSL